MEIYFNVFGIYAIKYISIYLFSVWVCIFIFRYRIEIDSFSKDERL